MMMVHDEPARTSQLKTHHSKLDTRKMRVDELRAELSARQLDTKGLKAQLVSRLSEALEDEKVNKEEQQSFINRIILK